MKVFGGLFIAVALIVMIYIMTHVGGDGSQVDSCKNVTHPISKTDSRYNPDLDRDNDGVICE